MIHFPCRHCGAKLKVPEAQAGKTGRCPRCKTRLVIPPLSAPAPPAESSGPRVVRPATDATPYDLAFLELPRSQPQGKPGDNAAQPDPALLAAGSYEAYRQAAQEQAEHDGKRVLSWPIDILLYPLNMAGLTTLGIVIVIPLLINLVAGLLGPFGLFIAIPGSIVNMVLSLYFLWYVIQCIADSALGGVRAPETIAQAPGLWDIATQMGRTLACMAVAALPLIIYWASTQKVDAAFWALSAWAVALCPMALLAVTMFDSIGGLSPLILIGSVLSTFLPYLGLVLVLGAMVFLIVNVDILLAESPLLGFAFGLAKFYLVLVAAHLLGRFYWRYQEQLNWDV